MIGANYSKTYWALVKRIQRLPKLLEESIDTITKKDAEGFLDEYKDGIKNDTFRLERLKKGTISQKKRKGFSQPETPLFGFGDSEKNSYINALRIRKLKKGYRVFISKAKHKQSGLPLNVIFDIHEKGRLIIRGNSVIRIPRRATREIAFKRFLGKKLRKENSQKVRKSIINFLRTGNYKKLK